MASKRHCTDVICLAVFGVAFAGLVFILIHANQNGDTRRLFHGMSYHGDLCGVDTPSKFLYFCQDMNGLGELDLERPVCADVCPQDSSEIITCHSGPTPGYETKVFADRLCVPVNAGKFASVTKELQENEYYMYTSKISELPEAWMALAASAVIAIMIGYIFLYTLERLVGPCICVFMILLTLLPTVFGAYIIWATRFDGGIEGWPTIQKDEYNFYIGVGLVVLGALLACISCCSLRSMEAAIGCVKAACEAMFSIPTLLLVPLFELLTKTLVMGLMVWGLLVLVSCGEIQSSSHGIYRHIHLTNTEKAYAAYYVFMMFWICELFTSVSQFVVAYTAQGWYFTPYQGGYKQGSFSFSVFEGYGLAYSFHFGTLLFGAILIATLRYIRMVLAWVAQQSQDSGNVIGACIARVCLCIVDCFKRTLEFVNKNAYIDVAINSSNFCSAGINALGVILSEVTAVAVLNGATFIIMIAAVGFIALGGACVTWVLCSFVPIFNDPSSAHYVYDPLFLGIVAGLISGVIGVAFMVVFDTVSDTILYCFALEKRNGDQSASEASTRASTKPSDSGSWASFLTCGRRPTELSKLGAQRVEYTPPALRKLVAEHR